MISALDWTIEAIVSNYKHLHGARFSKVPKFYGPFSGVTIPFVSEEQRGFKSSNFMVIFLFVTLKTC